MYFSGGTSGTGGTSSTGADYSVPPEFFVGGTGGTKNSFISQHEGVIMKINNTGHVVNSEGITTAPHASLYWLGDDTHRVGFDFLVLDNGRVALHAKYGNTLRQCHSEFFYDVIDYDKALASAQNLVNAAMSLLQAYCPDNDFDNDRGQGFLAALASGIAKVKRLGFYVVPND